MLVNVATIIMKPMTLAVAQGSQNQTVIKLRPTKTCHHITIG